MARATGIGLEIVDVLEKHAVPVSRRVNPLAPPDPQDALTSTSVPGTGSPQPRASGPSPSCGGGAQRPGGTTRA